MNTADNINYELSGCTLKVLTIHDTIHDDDFIRDLIQTGLEGGFATAYKPYKWNGLAWHTVSDDFSGWIGKTYADYMRSVDVDWDGLQENVHHEIVRVHPLVKIIR